ncbi:MAG TPA: glycine cleavage system protein H, partial [Planctomycetes bacterium]|nr:glycine cleavage system protein H [Planctomycetota bacterium]
MPAQFPDDYLYHPDALWLRKLEAGDEALVGLSHYAQDRLGGIVYVDLPSIGSAIGAGTPFGIIESNKTASDLIAPANGTVIACNADLDADPGLVNTACYEAGWLIRIRIDPADDHSALL